jgi:hypothetical protein
MEEVPTSKTSKTVFNAPENSDGVIAYHTDDGQPLDEIRLKASIEDSVGPAMEEAESIAFANRADK